MPTESNVYHGSGEKATSGGGCLALKKQRGLHAHTAALPRPPPRGSPGNRTGTPGWGGRRPGPRRTHHVLHADADLAVAVEGPIEAHDIRGVTLMQHLQLTDDLVPDGWLDLQVDQLQGRGRRGQDRATEGGREGRVSMYLRTGNTHPHTDWSGNVHSNRLHSN